MYNYRIIIIMEYVGGGVDYNSGPYTVQFDVGVTNVSFTVPVINDNILETDETFHLSISTLSLPNNVTVGGQGQTTVTILANDGKWREYVTSYSSLNT